MSSENFAAIAAVNSASGCRVVQWRFNPLMPLSPFLSQKGQASVSVVDVISELVTGGNSTLRDHSLGYPHDFDHVGAFFLPAMPPAGPALR